MRKEGMDKQKAAIQIEEAAREFAELRENTDIEIARIQQKLLDNGVPGDIVVKLQPAWRPGVNYLLRKEAEKLDSELFRKAG